MAYIDGPSLADKIKERPLPLDEALGIAIQVADGLQEAHEKGIVHRDVKPQNIMLTTKGQVKIMDFGLASLAGRSKLTKSGTTLGTPAYMAPEQLEATEVDRRADIWASGVVLYEMLTQHTPFNADYEQAIAYGILNEQPEPASAQRSDVQPAVDRVIQKALAKHPAERYQHADDLAVDLKRIRQELSATPAAAKSAGDSASPATVAARRLPWALAGLASMVAVVLALVHFNESSTLEEPVARPATRHVVNLPDSAHLALGTQYPEIGFEGPTLALSPDGRHLVYVGQSDGGTRLYHCDLTQFQDPQPISGTEGAVFAFFSPDAERIGFLTRDRVKTIRRDGGDSKTLSRVRTPVSASWIDQTIYVAGSQGYRLYRVPAEGGEAQEVFQVLQQLGRQGSISQVLPGGRGALVSLFDERSISGDQAEVWLASLDGGENKALAINGFYARYVASGHLVFGRQGDVFAAPFDLDSLEVTGDAVRVFEGVASDSNFGYVQFVFDENGTAAFIPGGDIPKGRVAWVDRLGAEGVLDIPERIYGVFDVTSDGKRFAIQVADVNDYVWLWSSDDGGRSIASELSLGWPTWNSDGTQLAVTSVEPRGVRSILVYDAQGQLLRPLYSAQGRNTAVAWVGNRIAVGHFDLGSIQVLALDPSEEPVSIWSRGGPESSAPATKFPGLSADGSMVAYSTDEGTGLQVWAERIEGGERVQVSTGGGVESVWSREGGELFFRQGNRFYASQVTTGSRLEVSTPKLVFVAPDFVDTKGLSYRVSSDGQRIYYVRRSRPPARNRIHIVHNSFKGLSGRERD